MALRAFPTTDSRPANAELIRLWGDPLICAGAVVWLSLANVNDSRQAAVVVGTRWLPTSGRYRVGTNSISWHVAGSAHAFAAEQNWSAAAVGHLLPTSSGSRDRPGAAPAERTLAARPASAPDRSDPPASAQEEARGLAPARPLDVGWSRPRSAPAPPTCAFNAIGVGCSLADSPKLERPGPGPPRACCGQETGVRSARQRSSPMSAKQ